jgi:RNase P protein component
MPGALPASRLGFAPRQRLLKAADFDRVYALRMRVSDSFFPLMPHHELGFARLGLSIGAGRGQFRGEKSGEAPGA